MKTYLYSSIIAAAAMMFAVQAYGASDYLLEIEGIKGECKGKKYELTENSDGSFIVSGIPGGTYKIVYTAKQGKTGSTKRGASDSPEVVEFTYEVKSPRDAASGQASGKRMHKPMTIRKELDKGMPTKFVVGEITVGDLDGDGSAEKSAMKPTYDLKLNKKL